MNHSTSNGAWFSTSVEIADLADAFVQAQMVMTNAPRTETANAGTYSYKYADLSTVMACIRTAFARFGLAITQTAETVDHDVIVWTTVLHKSGQYIQAQPTRLPAGTTAQQTGSAITYARRYALVALVGMATDDDDGATAAVRSPDSARAHPSREAGNRPSSPSPRPLVPTSSQPVRDEPDPAGEIPRPRLVEPTSGSRPASDKQKALISKLLAERDYQLDDDVDIDTLDIGAAKELIDTILRIEPVR